MQCCLFGFYANVLRQQRMMMVGWESARETVSPKDITYVPKLLAADGYEPKTMRDIMTLYIFVVIFDSILFLLQCNE